MVDHLSMGKDFGYFFIETLNISLYNLDLIYN